MTEQNLRAEDIDRLGQALITLTKELWVVSDRVKVLEAVLEDAEIMPPGAVDQYQPDEKLGASLNADRAELIETILSTLAPGK